MARQTIRERRQERAQQTAQCARWAADFLHDNPGATKKQVADYVNGRAVRAGFDWLALMQIIMQIIAQLFAK